MRDRGFIVWLTGLSGAGKSTLAKGIRDELLARGLRVEVLDGDEVRQNLSKGLGYSKEDRDTNVRRIGYVANLLARNGVAVVAAAISPYAAVRDEVRQSLDDGVSFIEVHVDCSLEVLRERDTKGLYAQAAKGQLDNLSGVSDPYEPPAAPEVHVDSTRQSQRECLRAVLEFIEAHDLAPGGGEG